MSVLFKAVVVISDDDRYVKGETYNLALDTGITPDPAKIVEASVKSDSTAIATSTPEVVS